MWKYSKSLSINFLVVFLLRRWNDWVMGNHENWCVKKNFSASYTKYKYITSAKRCRKQIIRIFHWPISENIRSMNFHETSNLEIYRTIFDENEMPTRCVMTNLTLFSSDPVVTPSDLLHRSSSFLLRTAFYACCTIKMFAMVHNN